MYQPQLGQTTLSGQSFDVLLSKRKGKAQSSQVAVQCFPTSVGAIDAPVTAPGIVVDGRHPMPKTAQPITNQENAGINFARIHPTTSDGTGAPFMFRVGCIWKQPIIGWQV